MARRGSLELSISTLITLILGTIVLAGGIVLVWKIVDDGSSIAAALSANERSMIAAQLSRGQLVAASPALVEIPAGKTAGVGVGVKNRLGHAEEFRIEAATFQGDVPVSTIRIRFFPTLAVDDNAAQIALLAVTPSEETPAGEYTVIVTVADSTGALYDSKRFFTVRVD